MRMLLIFLSISLVSFNSFGCTDFSGKYYYSEDSNNRTYNMIQSGCESIQKYDDKSEMTFNFDGKEKLLLEIDRGDTFVQVYISNTLEADKWIMQYKIKYTDKDGLIYYEKSWTENALNNEKDLVTVEHSSTGSVGTTVSKRVK